jgi:hypothetical protein
MSDKYCTFIKKYVIMLLLCVIPCMAFSETITIQNPDGSITLCVYNEQTKVLNCF